MQKEKGFGKNSKVIWLNAILSRHWRMFYMEFIEINVTFLCMLEHWSPVEADKLGPGFLSWNKQTNLNIQELFLEP